MSRLFVFGLGYSATAIGALLASKGWLVAGTVRSEANAVKEQGFSAVGFDDRVAVETQLNQATHLLVSIPPNQLGDPAWKTYADVLNRAAGLSWIGYLSTTGMYGDHGGAWVDENTPSAPVTGRGLSRLNAEKIWASFAESRSLPLDIFRLSSIYGYGRNPIDRVRAGKAQRIIKAGHVFNRIHIEDIAQIVVAAIEQRTPRTRVFNVADDDPAPPQDVLTYAAQLIGAPPPPEIAFKDAVLSPMARSFYEDNKRVKNEKVKRDLGISLKYPTYREGLLALSKDC